MSEAICCVCGEALGADRAGCYTCGGQFHLALRIDRPAPDCGDTWIDEESQALCFACNRCLGRHRNAAARAYRRREGQSARDVVRARRRPADGRGRSPE